MEGNSKPKRILIVDDEERLAKMMQMNLEATGRFEVQVESKGTRCLETARSFRPDFIFVDVKMPDLNGFEVMQRLKKDPDLGGVPSVFLTGALTKEGPTGDPQHDDAMIGQYPYIVKPTSTQDLIRCIEKYLGPF